MSYFINLTSRVINKIHIIEILKKPSKYYIYMSDASLNGTIIFPFGDIKTKQNVIEICETDNPKDYKNITEFIENVDNRIY